MAARPGQAFHTLHSNLFKRGPITCDICTHFGLFTPSPPCLTDGTDVLCGRIHTSPSFGVHAHPLLVWLSYMDGPKSSQGKKGKSGGPEIKVPSFPFSQFCIVAHIGRFCKPQQFFLSFPYTQNNHVFINNLTLRELLDLLQEIYMIIIFTTLSLRTQIFIRLLGQLKEKDRFDKTMNFKKSQYQH